MVPEQTSSQLIWRDDDISVRTNLRELLEVDHLLQTAGLRHTVAIIAKNLDTNPLLIAEIKSRRMDVQLHCWDHEDLTVDRTALADLSLGVEMIERVFGERPSVLYPPWNRADGRVHEVAASLGLRVSNEKVSLNQFIRVQGDIAERVVNFHYWSEEERSLLPEAIDVFKRRRHR